MKKTKIILPALAALCLGAAASVTGTVAWFSASKNSKIDVNNIAVINPEGSLTATVDGGYNTEANTAGDAISMKQVTGKTEYWKLRDFSTQVYAEGTGESKVIKVQGWKATNAGASTDYPDWSTTYEKVSADDGYVYNSNSHIGYLATWTMTLTANGAPTDKFNINFDASSSISMQTTGQELDAIFQGLRIAFVTSKDFFIWTPGRNAKPTNGVQYVNATSIATPAAAPKYDDANIILSGASKTIGTVDAGSSLTVNCYMWFEGTDEKISSSNLSSGQSVAALAVMNFSAALSA